jgi:hypothetical protein
MPGCSSKLGAISNIMPTNAAMPATSDPVIDGSRYAISDPAVEFFWRDGFSEPRLDLEQMLVY